MRRAITGVSAMAKRKAASKNVQIGADVHPELRDQILAYAESLHLSEGALVTLLIARELRLKRLESLPCSKPSQKTTPRSRLTGRQSTPALRSDFEAHVASLEIARPIAIATLAEAELREKWLQKALESKWESS
jgi:hypothetical protein